MKTQILLSSWLEKLGIKGLVLYNCTERCTEVNCSVELGRGGMGVNTMPPCTSAFSRHFTAGLG